MSDGDAFVPEGSGLKQAGSPFDGAAAEALLAPASLSVGALALSRIDYLANCPQHAQTLAEWVVREWGYLRPGLSVEQSRDEFLARAVSDRIPLALVALQGTEVVGCINLKLDEDLTRSGLSPWIGALYVREDHRGEGIGGELLQMAVEVAQRLGVPRLHLSATDAEAFYLARGWQVLDRLHRQGEDITLLCLDLDPPAAR